MWKKCRLFRKDVVVRKKKKLPLALIDFVEVKHSVFPCLAPFTVRLVHDAGKPRKPLQSKIFVGL